MKQILANLLVLLILLQPVAAVQVERCQPDFEGNEVCETIDIPSTELTESELAEKVTELTPAELGEVLNRLNPDQLQKVTAKQLAGNIDKLSDTQLKALKAEQLKDNLGDIDDLTKLDKDAAVEAMRDAVDFSADLVFVEGATFDGTNLITKDGQKLDLGQLTVDITDVIMKAATANSPGGFELKRAGNPDVEVYGKDMEVTIDENGDVKVTLNGKPIIVKQGIVRQLPDGVQLDPNTIATAPGVGTLTAAPDKPVILLSSGTRLNSVIGLQIKKQVLQRKIQKDPATKEESLKQLADLDKQLSVAIEQATGQDSVALVFANDKGAFSSVGRFGFDGNLGTIYNRKISGLHDKTLMLSQPGPEGQTLFFVDNPEELAEETQIGSMRVDWHAKFGDAPYQIAGLDPFMEFKFSRQGANTKTALTSESMKMLGSIFDDRNLGALPEGFDATWPKMFVVGMSRDASTATSITNEAMIGQRQRMKELLQAGQLPIVPRFMETPEEKQEREELRSQATESLKEALALAGTDIAKSRAAYDAAIKDFIVEGVPLQDRAKTRMAVDKINLDIAKARAEIAAAQAEFDEANANYGAVNMFLQFVTSDDERYDAAKERLKEAQIRMGKALGERNKLVGGMSIGAQDQLMQNQRQLLNALGDTKDTFRTYLENEIAATEAGQRSQQDRVLYTLVSTSRNLDEYAERERARIRQQHPTWSDDRIDELLDQKRTEVMDGIAKNYGYNTEEQLRSNELLAGRLDHIDDVLETLRDQKYAQEDAQASYTDAWVRAQEAIRNIDTEGNEPTGIGVLDGAWNLARTGANAGKTVLLDATLGSMIGLINDGFGVTPLVDTYAQAAERNKQKISQELADQRRGLLTIQTLANQHGTGEAQDIVQTLTTVPPPTGSDPTRDYARTTSERTLANLNQEDRQWVTDFDNAMLRGMTPEQRQWVNALANPEADNFLDRRHTILADMHAVSTNPDLKDRSLGAGTVLTYAMGANDRTQEDIFARQLRQAQENEEAHLVKTMEEQLALTLRNKDGSFDWWSVMNPGKVYSTSVYILGSDDYDQRNNAIEDTAERVNQLRSVADSAEALGSTSLNELQNSLGIMQSATLLTGEEREVESLTALNELVNTNTDMRAMHLVNQYGSWDAVPVNEKAKLASMQARDQINEGNYFGASASVREYSEDAADQIEDFAEQKAIDQGAIQLGEFFTTTMSYGGATKLVGGAGGYVASTEIGQTVMSKIAGGVKMLGAPGEYVLAMADDFIKAGQMEGQIANAQSTLNQLRIQRVMQSAKNLVVGGSDDALQALSGEITAVESAIQGMEAAKAVGDGIRVAQGAQAVEKVARAQTGASAALSRAVHGIGGQVTQSASLKESAEEWVENKAESICGSPACAALVIALGSGDSVVGTAHGTYAGIQTRAELEHQQRNFKLQSGQALTRVAQDVGPVEIDGIVYSPEVGIDEFGNTFIDFKGDETISYSDIHGLNELFAQENVNVDSRTAATVAEAAANVDLDVEADIINRATPTNDIEEATVKARGSNLEAERKKQAALKKLRIETANFYDARAQGDAVAASRAAQNTHEATAEIHAASETQHRAAQDVETANIAKLRESLAETTGTSKEDEFKKEAARAAIADAQARYAEQEFRAQQEAELAAQARLEAQQTAAREAAADKARKERLTAQQAMLKAQKARAQAAANLAAKSDAIGEGDLSNLDADFVGDLSTQEDRSRVEVERLNEQEQRVAKRVYAENTAGPVDQMRLRDAGQFEQEVRKKKEKLAAAVESGVQETIEAAEAEVRNTVNAAEAALQAATKSDEPLTDDGAQQADAEQKAREAVADSTIPANMRATAEAAVDVALETRTQNDAASDVADTFSEPVSGDEFDVEGETAKVTKTITAADGSTVYEVEVEGRKKVVPALGAPKKLQPRSVPTASATVHNLEQARRKAEEVTGSTQEPPSRELQRRTVERFTPTSSADAPLLMAKAAFDAGRPLTDTERTALEGSAQHYDTARTMDPRNEQVTRNAAAAHALLGNGRTAQKLERAANMIERTKGSSIVQATSDVEADAALGLQSSPITLATRRSNPAGPIVAEIVGPGDIREVAERGVTVTNDGDVDVYLPGEFTQEDVSDLERMIEEEADLPPEAVECRMGSAGCSITTDTPVKTEKKTEKAAQTLLERLKQPRNGLARRLAETVPETTPEVEPVGPEPVLPVTSENMAHVNELERKVQDALKQGFGEGNVFSTGSSVSHTYVPDRYGMPNDFDFVVKAREFDASLDARTAALARELEGTLSDIYGDVAVVPHKMFVARGDANFAQTFITVHRLRAGESAETYRNMGPVKASKESVMHFDFTFQKEFTGVERYREYYDQTLDGLTSKLPPGEREAAKAFFADQIRYLKKIFQGEGVYKKQEKGLRGVGTELLMLQLSPTAPSTLAEFQSTFSADAALEKIAREGSSLSITHPLTKQTLTDEYAHDFTTLVNVANKYKGKSSEMREAYAKAEDEPVRADPLAVGKVLAGLKKMDVSKERPIGFFESFQIPSADSAQQDLESAYNDILDAAYDIRQIGKLNRAEATLAAVEPSIDARENVNQRFAVDTARALIKAVREQTSSARADLDILARSAPPEVETELQNLRTSLSPIEVAAPTAPVGLSTDPEHISGQDLSGKNRLDTLRNMDQDLANLDQDANVVNKRQALRRVHQSYSAMMNADPSTADAIIVPLSQLSLESQAQFISENSNLLTKLKGLSPSDINTVLLHAAARQPGALDAMLGNPNLMAQLRGKNPKEAGTIIATASTDPRLSARQNPLQMRKPQTLYRGMRVTPEVWQQIVNMGALHSPLFAGSGITDPNIVEEYVQKRVAKSAQSGGLEGGSDASSFDEHVASDPANSAHSSTSMDRDLAKKFAEVNLKEGEFSVIFEINNYDPALFDGFMTTAQASYGDQELAFRGQLDFGLITGITLVTDRSGQSVSNAKLQTDLRNAQSNFKSSQEARAADSSLGRTEVATKLFGAWGLDISPETTRDIILRYGSVENFLNEVYAQASTDGYPTEQSASKIGELAGTTISEENARTLVDLSRKSSKPPFVLTPSLVKEGLAQQPVLERALQNNPVAAQTFATERQSLLERLKQCG